MPQEREIAEAVARCVATLVYFQNDERTPEWPHRLSAELRSLVSGIHKLGVDRKALQSQFIPRVQGELLARYGHEVGPRLGMHFLDAVDS